MKTEQKDRNWAAIGSTTFHTLCILALVFGLKACGSGLGNGIGNGIGDGLMELSIADLGDYEQGLGESQAAASRVEAQPMPEPENDEVISDDESQVTAPKTESKPKTSTPTKPADKPKDPQKVSSGLEGVLSKIGSGSGDGNTSGSGDEGNPEGQEGGAGNNNGNGGGSNGYNYRLTGRTSVVDPKIEGTKEAGRIVLDIYVDRNGNVVSTQRNYNKSTSTSDYLFKLAETAAMKAKFSVKADAPPQQKGEMTFNFKLQ